MIVDLFAGPGGWDEGLLINGRSDVVGIEIDKDAAASREMAGHDTICADVTSLNPLDFSGAEGLIASPPCQSFSSAGKQLGMADIRGQLVYEVIRWAEKVEPAWIACEEVKEVEPIWKSFASQLSAMGYKTWVGLLNAADYGVPQVRKRAFLLASRNPFALPRPTHTSSLEPDLFGENLRPWVTLAEALGFDESMRTRDNAWAWLRPATTVVRSFRPDVIAAPGWRGPGDGPRQNAPGSFVVTEKQLMVLQSIRPDYPITANGKTKRLSLIGAFLPPLWAAAILRPVLKSVDVSATCKECGNTESADGLTNCLECL